MNILTEGSNISNLVQPLSRSIDLLFYVVLSWILWFDYLMKNKIDIFVSDLDGTLLNEKKMVEPYNTKAINKWIGSNHRFWVASGRGHDCRSLLAKYDVYPEYVIGSTGSTIHDANDQLIYAFNGYITNLPQLIHYLLTRQYCGFMFDQIKGNGVDNTKRYGVDTNHLVSNHIHQSLDDILPALSLDLTNVEVMKIFAVFTNDALAIETRDELIRSFDCMAYHADTNCLEIVAKGCSKAGALSWLCHHLDIDLRTVAAIGDAENDIEMIQQCGYGYIMSTANQEFKSATDHIVDSVAQAIDELL